MAIRLARILAGILLAGTIWSGSSWADTLPGTGARRVSFVVGNSAYQDLNPLANPSNDAHAVAAKLKAAGFDVVTAFDLDRLTFEEKLRTFLRSLDGSEVSLFYYSGHGVQIGGDNRLIPVDATLKSAPDMEVQTISVNTILGYMQRHSRDQVIFLDSCRKNPFPRDSYFIGGSLESTARSFGLAAQTALPGSVVVFSTQPGSFALDGAGPLSPFTDAVLRHSFKLAEDLQTSLMKVTKDVWEVTNFKQRPWVSASLTEPLYLMLPTVRPAVVTGPGGGSSDSGDDSGVSLQRVASAISRGEDQPIGVPIGVGGVPIFADFPMFHDDMKISLELVEEPDQGVLSLDDEPLTQSAKVSLTDIGQIRYEPARDGNSPTVASWLLHGAVDEAPIRVDTTLMPMIVDCDREAGEPLDLQGVGKGKLPDGIDVMHAIKACTDAVQQFGQVARFKYQLGRAELAAKQVDTALAHFTEAERQGHIRALYALGYLAQRGIGQNQDIAKAEGYFTKGADLGDPYSMLTHGRNLVRGRGTAADVKKGLTYLNRAAELGHTYALNELGSMYFDGRAVKRNYQRGVRFFEAALARDDIYAMNNLGIAYRDGLGVAQDTGKAMELFAAATARGHPTAPTNIGNLYLDGKGVTQDPSRAMDWFAIGAERGDTWAAFQLGQMFESGPETKRDAVKSVEYLALAVALDTYGTNPKALDLLKAASETAKATAIERLTQSGIQGGDPTTPDLAGTLVNLERIAWHKRNPRMDLF
jgi:TPR repeat protein